MQEHIDTVEAAFRQIKKKLCLSISEHSTSFVWETLAQFLNHSKLRAELCQITQEEARCTFVFQMDKFFLKGVEDALSEELQIDVESTMMN